MLAQSGKIVFLNKKTQKATSFNIPRYAKIKLLNDSILAYSDIIIDSIKLDTIFVSNPLNRVQNLAIATKNIDRIKIPNYMIMDALKYASSGFFILGGVELLVEKLDKKKPESTILASVFCFALTALINFTGPKRSFNQLDYLIMSSNK